MDITVGEDNLRIKVFKDANGNYQSTVEKI